MRYPDPKVTKALGVIVRQYPEILEWLDEWKMTELEKLPHVINNPALQQGRCQVLGEIHKFAKEAPEIVKAKSI
jgi:hypothetical protein